MSESDSFMNVMIGAVFAVAGVVVLAPTLQQIFAATPAAQLYAAQVYTGLTDYRILDADGQLRWLSLVDAPPFTPWITASFFNDGDVTTDPPGAVSVYIAINNPDALVELKKGESQYADFSFAQRRIEIIFYKTDPSKKARVRVEGKY
ncbi:hypothetical protein ES703_104436 [subsurface metagenome]